MAMILPSEEKPSSNFSGIISPSLGKRKSMLSWMFMEKDDSATTKSRDWYRVALGSKLATLTT
jgi:hypothetical protein